MSTNKPSIFITGAAVGIGKATAELFAAKGWFVGLFDVDEDGLQTLKAQLGEDACMAMRMDVTDEASVNAAMTAFGERTGGRMQVLFNNAGILDTTAFAETHPDMPERIFMVNVCLLYTSPSPRD